MKSVLDMAEALNDCLDMVIDELCKGTENLELRRVEHFINADDQIVIIYHSNPSCDLNCIHEIDPCKTVIIKAEFINGKAKIVYNEDLRLYRDNGRKKEWQKEFLQTLNIFVMPFYDQIKKYKAEHDSKI